MKCTMLTNIVSAVVVGAAMTMAVEASAQIAPPPREGIVRVAARLEPEIRRAMLEGNIPSMVIALTDREGEL